MNKATVFMLSFLLLSGALTSYAQFADVDVVKTANFEMKANAVFKPARLQQNTEEALDVVGLGAPIISVSNVGDGTASSYQHSLRVTYPLLIAGNKAGYTLVFYGETEKIPYAVVGGPAGTTAYFPYSLHDQIKSKIEQSITARKKVQLKITQKVDGFREAVLSFN